MQPLLNHQDKTKNVPIIREEQDVRELHNWENKKQKQVQEQGKNHKEKVIRNKRSEQAKRTQKKKEK
jgi:hypothetical protein